MDFPVCSSSKTSHKAGSRFWALVTGLDTPRLWSYSLTAQNGVKHVASSIGVKKLLLAVIQQIRKLRAIND